MTIKENGDLIFEDGELVPVGEIEDVRLELQCVFNTRKGEFFLDSDLGFDYTNLETKGASDDVIITDIMDAIAQVERITEIVDINIKRNHEQRLVDIYIKVKMDELELEEVISLDVWNK